MIRIVRAGTANESAVGKLMFRLLPIQILIAVIASLNSIISALFASNFLDLGAMGAVGLYAPVQMLVSAISATFVGGATILCGQYMGKNESKKMRGIFSLDIAFCVLLGLIIAATAMDAAAAKAKSALFISGRPLRPTRKVRNTSRRSSSRPCT